MPRADRYHEIYWSVENKLYESWDTEPKSWAETAKVRQAVKDLRHKMALMREWPRCELCDKAVELVYNYEKRDNQTTPGNAPRSVIWLGWVCPSSTKLSNYRYLADSAELLARLAAGETK